MTEDLSGLSKPQQESDYNLPVEKNITSESIKQFLQKWAYPKLFEPIPEAEAITDETIAASQKEYINWLRRKEYPYDVALEPGRSAVWGHATSFEGLQRIINTGFLRSAKRVLKEGEAIAHAGGGKVRKIIWRLGIDSSSKLADLSPEQQTAILQAVDDDVAGSVGHLVIHYSIPAIEKRHALQLKLKKSSQFAIIFSTSDLISQYGRLYQSGERSADDSWDKARLSSRRQRLALMPHKTYQGDEGRDEFQILTDSENGTQIPVKNCLLLVPKSRESQIREELNYSAKTSRDLVIVPFLDGENPEENFESINEALGWLTNDPVGRYFFQEATKNDAIELLNQDIPIKSAQWIVDFIASGLQYLKDLLKDEWLQRYWQKKLPENKRQHGLKINYLSQLLEDFKGKLGVIPSSSINPHYVDYF